MSSYNGLFDEDSSEDEEFEPQTKESKNDSPKRTIQAQSSDDDDDDNDDDEKPSKDEKPAEDKQKTASTTELFGDEDFSDDDNDNGNDNGNDKDKDKDGAMKVDTLKQEKSPKKKMSSMSGGVLGDSDDESEGEEAKLDDVVGSAAPVTKEKPGQDAGADAAASSAYALKPPEKATVLETTRPGSNVSLHMTKLPNLVAIQPAAFDETLYIENEEEEQYKGYVHNMIRWRYKRNSNGEVERDGDGNLVRESNSRIVQWSDGSFTLHIGNEAFDVQTIDSSTNNYAGLNGYIYLSQKATFSNGEDGEDDTPGGTVLECMAPVASRFVPKPSSLQSEAHKSLTIAVRQRTIKKARIAEYVTHEDPEKAKAARIRNKDDLDKATARRTSSYRPGRRYTRAPGMNRNYLEADEDDGDYDTTNIKALKKGTMDDDMDDYGDESEDDGYDATFRRGTRRMSRNRKEESEEEEEELVFDEESDEEEGTLIKAHKKTSKRPAQAVFDDDDED